MRVFIFTTFFCTIASVCFGQYATKISIQTNALPSFKVNSTSFEGSSSQGLRISIFNYGAELGFRLFRGYDSSVDFSFGGNLALVLAEAGNHKFKTGLHIDRFFLNDYKKNDEEIGGIIEDDITESFQPYIEWEWVVSKPVSIFTQAGYRIMNSETRRVTDIKYDTNIVTGEKTPVGYQTKDIQNYYGSGFELGVGLSVIIF